MIDTPLKLAAACPFQQTYSPNFRDEPEKYEKLYPAITEQETNS